MLGTDVSEYHNLSHKLAKYRKNMLDLHIAFIMYFDVILGYIIIVVIGNNRS